MKLTPKIDTSRLLRRNEALEMLGLSTKLNDVEWLKKRWEGAILWSQWKRKALKAYSLNLIESLRDELEDAKNNQLNSVQEQ
jgi:hypothetical protein